VSLLIRGAVLDGTPQSIRIKKGRIVEIAPGDTEGEAGRVIDARGLHAFPSFKNGHTHVSMVLFRGYGDDMPLMQWLQTRIWPAEKHLTEEDVYLGARLGILEMIRGGTTFFNEMYWHRRAIVRAVQEMGVHALVGITIIDIGDAELLARQKGEAAELIEERRSRRASGASIRGAPATVSTSSGATTPSNGPVSASTGWPAAGQGVAELALAPHAIYTVTPPVLKWIGEVASEENLPVHIHLSETSGEVEDCLQSHGCRPTEHLDRLGLVGPRLIAAHGQFLDDAELARLGEVGATVVTNPSANLKLATGGIFPYRAARAFGVRVCLGTDGAASNNNLDMLQEMKLAALLQKHREQDATVLPAGEALGMATTSPSQAFGLGSGKIEVGERADLILVDLSGPSTQPVHDPVSSLVYAARAGNVHTTICEGRVLMHAGKVEVCDEREVIESAAAAARALVARSEAS
jgi:5-methylthioadenosine/S-adenosylhomocysteine deaminase